MKQVIAIIVYSLWFTVNAQAASTIVKVGVDPFSNSFSEVKYFTVGREMGVFRYLLFWHPHKKHPAPALP